MSDFLQSYRVRITPLTPVHVGSGEVLEPYQYLLRNHEVWVLDPARLLSLLPEDAANEYLNSVERGPLAARKQLMQLADRFDLAPAVAWRAPAAQNLHRFLSRALDRGTGELGLRLFPRALEGAYLPGSSLKGAIRTTLLFDASRNELQADLDEASMAWKGQYDLIWDHPNRKLAHGRWRKVSGQGSIRPPFALKRPRRDERRAALPINQAFEATVLHTPFKGGKPDITGDPFRALGISDSTPIARTAFHLIEVFGSRKNPEASTGIAQLAQVWTEGAVETNLRFYRGMLQHPKSVLAKSSKALRGRLRSLAANAYERLINLAEAELYEYDQRGWNEAANAMERVLDAIETCLDDEGALREPYRFPLRLGYGSGELTMRLAEFIEYPTRHGGMRIDPVSRKLSERLPLGWVMLEVIE